MKTVHIYKISTFKYYLTTFYNENSTKYKYISSIDVKNSLKHLSLCIGIENRTKIKCCEISTLHFELEIFNLKHYLKTINEFVDVSHDIFSNVHTTNFINENFFEIIFIHNEQIFENNVDEYHESLKIDSIEELTQKISEPIESIDLYVMSIQISTNPRESTRRKGSCMENIYEYHIPFLNISYNFYDDDVNILIGNTICDRYIEHSFDKPTIKIVSHETLNGEKLTKILKFLKSYATFKLNAAEIHSIYKN